MVGNCARTKRCLRNINAASGCQMPGRPTCEIEAKDVLNGPPGVPNWTNNNSKSRPKDFAANCPRLLYRVCDTRQARRLNLLCHRCYPISLGSKMNFVSPLGSVLEGPSAWTRAAPAANAEYVLSYRSPALSTYIHTCMHAYIHRYVCIYICGYVYIYIDMYTYIYRCVYRYVYINRCV